MSWAYSFNGKTTVSKTVVVGSNPTGPAKNMNTIFETKYWLVKLGSDQTYLGRATIVFKGDKGELSDLSEEEMLDFLSVVKKYEFSLKKMFGATMFNWTCLMNNSFKEKPYSPLVHWHARPRYDHEVLLSDVLFIDPNFAHHYNREANKEVSEELQKIIVTKIQEGLE